MLKVIKAALIIAVATVGFSMPADANHVVTDISLNAEVTQEHPVTLRF